MAAQGKGRWIQALATMALAVGPFGPLGAAGSGPVSGSTPKVVLDPGVIGEMSEARQHPMAYARHLRRLLGQFKGKIREIPGGVLLRTKEGEPAVEEAIAFLEHQTPLGPLGISHGLGLAALDHAGDQGSSGQIGHTGSQGQTLGKRVERYGRFGGILGEDIHYGASEAREIVVDLIIDDGVPSRGHRQNIFNAKFRVAGAALGTHATYRHMCVIDFADTFTEK